MWVFSMLLFAVVAMFMLFSTYFMNQSIREEEAAQELKSKFREQGENLVRASDYLTSEVRKFAVTGDMKNFHNYWNEVRNVRRREKAIQEFEKADAPGTEKRLLEESKQYSDLLVGTEKYSMKLVLTSLGVTADQYREDPEMQECIEEVLAYNWPEGTETLTAEEMRDRAVYILYDKSYEEYKNKIMTPVSEFESIMNQRLDLEVVERQHRTRAATVMQIVIAASVIAAIAFILVLVSRFYISPLKKYTEKIGTEDVGFLTEKNVVQTEEIFKNQGLVPEGSYETIQLAKAFNQLIEKFRNELSMRKTAEESMRFAWTEAQKANKAKGVFLDQVTYELRHPLNEISEYTSLLEQTNITADQRRYLGNIRNSADVLLNLIGDILDYTRMESGTMKMDSIPFCMESVITEVKTVIEDRALEKGLYLKVEMDKNIPENLIGDPVKIRQLLINLASNAIKFTLQGGVTISLNVEEKTEKRCLIRFVVSDTGIGIAEDEREAIFQPFSPDNSDIDPKNGTRLGLAICRQIVEASGDGSHSLRVRSRKGVGSDFSFRMDFMLADENLAAMEETE